MQETSRQIFQEQSLRSIEEFHKVQAHSNNSLLGCKHINHEQFTGLTTSGAISLVFNHSFLKSYSFFVWIL